MPTNLSVPHRRQQRDGDCLPACVQMVLAYWGRERSLATLAHQLDTHPDVGTPASRVLRLQGRTLSVAYRQAEIDEIHTWLKQEAPVIALVDTGELPYWSRQTAHAVVVVGLEGQTVALNDPAFDQAPLTTSLGDFELARDAVDNYVAVIRPVS